MTTQELDHYSATEIMGWPALDALDFTVPHKDGDFAGVTRWGTGGVQMWTFYDCKPGGKCGAHGSDWHPSTSRDQLYEVMKNCSLEIQKRAGYIVGHKDDLVPVSTLCTVAMDKPWYALEALVTAHKEANKT